MSKHFSPAEWLDACSKRISLSCPQRIRFSLCSVYFVREYIPETTGMTLEDIEDKIESVHSQESEFSPLAALNGKGGHSQTSKVYGSIPSTQES